MLHGTKSFKWYNIMPNIVKKIYISENNFQCYKFPISLRKRHLWKMYTDMNPETLSVAPSFRRIIKDHVINCYFCVKLQH